LRVGVVRSFVIGRVLGRILDEEKRTVRKGGVDL
jgi:hypothetical protein